jgi:DNA ligase-1
MPMFVFRRMAMIRTVVILLLGAVIAHTEPAAPPVMLAHTWTPEMEIRGWWMSEKLDGIRGYWTGRELVSRSGRVFAAPATFTANFPTVPLDGELWIGRQKFAEVSGIVRRQQAGPEWERVRYLIFDAPQAAGGFEQRLDVARRWFQQHPNPYVTIVPHEICQNASHLQHKLDEIEALGGEGLMLRRPQSPYTAGRSYDLLKVKRFQDAEAVVLQHLPGAGRHAGRMGALLVELPNGVRFEVGTGFTDAERNNPPPIGSTITFKYHGLTASGKPRFATFLRIREKM